MGTGLCVWSNCTADGGHRSRYVNRMKAQYLLNMVCEKSSKSEFEETFTKKAGRHSVHVPEPMAEPAAAPAAVLAASLGSTAAPPESAPPAPSVREGFVQHADGSLTPAPGGSQQ